MSTFVEPSDRHVFGELCVGADFACAHGDLETLGHIAQQLAAYAHEPLHCKLVVLADFCRCEPDRAIPAWLSLKEQLVAQQHASS